MEILYLTYSFMLLYNFIYMRSHFFTFPSFSCILALSHTHTLYSFKFPSSAMTYFLLWVSDPLTQNPILYIFVWPDCFICCHALGTYPTHPNHINYTVISFLLIIFPTSIHNNATVLGSLFKFLLG